MHRRQHGAAAPDTALRMADVPVGTRLLGDPQYPTLVVENVVMLPGVPQFFRFQFDGIAGMLAAAPFRLASIYVSVGEDRIASLLDRLAVANPAVEIGSYPRFDAADHRVKITIEAKDASRVAAVLEALIASLPAGALVRTEGP
jgi:molybdopterin-biosynthesis enzyme MoeA-like protein